MCRQTRAIIDSLCESSVLSYDVASNVSTACESEMQSYEVASNVSTDTGDW